MEIATIKRGESFTFKVVLNAEYDMARLKEYYLYIGGRAMTGTVNGNAITVKLRSEDTDLMSGTNKITLWLDDTILGVQKPYLGDMVVSMTNADESNTSVSEVDNALIPVTITATAVTVGDILYNYMKGVKGDPFLYSDFTPEQIESLKIKGDPFLYEDFTPEQIVELQRPATDAATAVNEAEALRVTAETTRVENEQGRVTAEGTRQNNEIARENSEDDRDDAEALRLSAEVTRGQNEQARITAEGLRVTAEGSRQTNTATAITNANNAATNANTKAGLADTAATNANTKATLANNAAILANEKAGLANTAATNADNARLAIAGDLALKEATSNKQNSLTPDGTGTKFPTVDAVKSRADEIESLIIRKLVEPLGATYNTTTKLFSLNGLTDITEAQMINIYNYTAVMIKASSWNEAFNSVSFRTNIQGTSKGNLNISASYSFMINPALEVFKMNGGVYLTSTMAMFYNCTSLREVNFIYMQMTTAGNAAGTFENCSVLVTCNLRNVKVNLSFAWSPLLSLASLQYLIQYRANGTTPITITVHPTVFAKLTDNTNYPTWYAVNQDALTKYITFASA